MMENPAPSMLRPALIGGVVFGVASGIPFLDLLNCACCALVIGSGFLAAYLQSDQCRRVGAEFRPASGATVGLISAPFFAVASTATSALFSLVIPAPTTEELRDQFDQFGQTGDLDPEFFDAVIRVMEMLQGPLGLIFSFFFALLIAAAFATIGGLIGGAVFKVESAGPPAPTGAAAGPSEAMPPYAPPGADGADKKEPSDSERE